MAIRRIAQVGLGSRLGGGGSILTTARFAQIGRGQCGGKARRQGLEFQLGGIIWRLPKPLYVP